MAMHTLHVAMHDGSATHVIFTKEAWERNMHDPLVKSQWSHRPDDCHDPVERLRAARGSVMVRNENPQETVTTASAVPKPPQKGQMAFDFGDN